MADTTTFIVGLFILLASAVLVGELFTRLGQAALVGQLLVGVILGPTLLGPALGLSSSNAELAGIQFLATFFLLVMAGLEVSPEEVYRTGLAAGTLGVAIFVGPFLAGAVIIPLILPSISFGTATFVSLTLSITALPVMGVMIVEFGLVKSRIGILLMNAAVINELAAVTVFAVLLRLHQGGSGSISVLIAVISTALFLATVLAVHMVMKSLRKSRIWDSLRRHFQTTWRSREAGFAILMVMALGAALYSQFLGLTFLIGAFYAGLLITPQSAGTREHQSIRQVFDSITWGFFVPLFFAFVGISMNLRTLGSSWLLLAVFGALILFAILSKLLVGVSIARILHWESREALAIGFFVSSRGAVELAMAVILLQNGVFTVAIFTLVATVGLVTTIVAPLGAARYGGLGADAEGGARLSPWSGILEGPERSLPDGVSQVDETPLV